MYKFPSLNVVPLGEVVRRFGRFSRACRTEDFVHCYFLDTTIVIVHFFRHFDESSDNEDIGLIRAPALGSTHPFLDFFCKEFVKMRYIEAHLPCFFK